MYIPKPSTKEIVHDNVLTPSKAETFVPHMNQHRPIEDSQLSAHAISDAFYTASASTGSKDDGHQAQGNPTLRQGDSKTCCAQNQTMELRETRYSAMPLVGNQQESHQAVSKESEQGHQRQDIVDKSERGGAVPDRSFARGRGKDDVSRQVSGLKQVFLDACRRGESYGRGRH